MDSSAEVSAQIKKERQELGEMRMKHFAHLGIETYRLHCEKKKALTQALERMQMLDGQIKEIEEQSDKMFGELRDEAMATTRLGSPLSFSELVRNIQTKYSCNRPEAMMKLYQEVFHPPQAQPIGACQHCRKKKAVVKLLKNGATVCFGCLPKVLAAL